MTDNVGVSSYSLAIEPTGAVAFTEDVLGSTPTHKHGTWTVDTSAGAMPPCGYVVRLVGYDVAVVDCNTSWSDPDTKGFCLRAAP